MRHNLRATKKENADRMYLLAKLLVKYRGAMPKLAMKELFQIDFIRKNFSEVTMYNYILLCRRLLKTGIKPKALPMNLANDFLKLAGREPLKETTTTEETTTEEKVVEENCCCEQAKAISIDEEIERLNKKCKALERLLDKKSDEKQDWLNKINEEITKKENEFSLLRVAVQEEIREICEQQKALMKLKIEQEILKELD